ncbi:MAG: nucleotidyltransferase family protein [Candidatus Omnitrophica bacterium]|nr:nucleotidyltransferase family protein [Candidatus Omnitrophota bacterium]
MGDNVENMIRRVSVSPEMSIKESLRKIDESGIGNLFVCGHDGELLGSLTDGDVRRRILETGDLMEPIERCYNRNPVYLNEGRYDIQKVRSLMLEKTIEALPVVDETKKIVKILFWKEVFQGEKVFREKIDVPVVIMAGGKGKRLDPFTRILPKPLIPIGEKPMIEVIVDNFVRQGAEKFFVTLNFKGDMIKLYFDSIEKNYKLGYIREDEFLGTAGSLKLLPADIGERFIVSNCDVIVKAEYKDLIKFHDKNKNLLTVAGAIHYHKIPYGVIRFGKDGKIQSIQEKPELDLTVNSGVYVVSKEAVELIPEGKRFDMTDLIQALLSAEKNVGVYPVMQSNYIDVGQWEEYKNHINELGI